MGPFTLELYTNDHQLDREGKDFVFTTTLIAPSGFNPYPSYVVASLNKTLCDDYLFDQAANLGHNKYSENSAGNFVGSQETS